MGQNHAKHARAVASDTSQANSGLMRMSPLAVFGHAAEPPGAGADSARHDASLTHPHPACRNASRGVRRHNRVRGAERRGRRQRSTNSRGVGGGGICSSVMFAPGCRNHREQRLADFTRSDGLGEDRDAERVLSALCTRRASKKAWRTPSCAAATPTPTRPSPGHCSARFTGRTPIPAQWRNAVLACRPEAGRPGVLRPRPREYWPVDVLELAERLLVLGGRENERA